MKLEFVKNTPRLRYFLLGVVGNNLVDELVMVIDKVQDSVDLSEFTPTLKITSVKDTYADTTTDFTTEIDEERGKIIITYLTPDKVTRERKVDMQLQFEKVDEDGETTIIWQSKIFTITFDPRIEITEAIETSYPDVLTDLQTQITKNTNAITLLQETTTSVDLSSVTEQIETEASNRETADNTLQSNIDTLKESVATDLQNYYTKSETYSQSEINSQISTIPKFAIEVVEELPTADISATTIYLVKDADSSSGNLYTEYIYVNSEWETLGAQVCDLTGYATTDEVNNAISSIDLSNYVQVTDYATNSVFGIVRADQINGIQASNGVLSIMGATDTQVGNKASNGRPLQAKHIDKIVQLGITTNTNTLTEDEQTAAQEWLGIEQTSEYELVNTLTLTEESSYIHFDTTDNGDAWDFDSVSLVITIPACESSSRVIVSGTGTGYALHLGMSTSTSATTNIISEIKKFGGSGRYITESTYTTGTSWVSYNSTIYRNYREVFLDSATFFSDRITMLYIYLEGNSSNPLPVDTTVKVYGKK